MSALDAGGGDSGEDCHAAARRGAGGCCAPGTLWSGAACVAVGPPECATIVAAAPEACVPRWCATWQGRDGATCLQGGAWCAPRGAPCPADSPAAVAGCPVFSVPGADGTCAAIGGPAAPKALGLDAPPPPQVPPPPRWCRDGPDAPARDCLATEQGCPVGAEPDPKVPGACLPLAGTTMICPAGFVATTPVAGGGLPGCVPDPAACGDDAFGGVSAGPGVVFVAADAAGKPDGSRAAPYPSIAQGLAAVPDGGVVAIAAGTYPETLKIAKPALLRGRCAALVRIVPVAGKAGVAYDSAAATGSALQGVQIASASVALRIEQASVAVERVWIVDATDRGVSAGNGGKATLADVVVSRTVGGEGYPHLGVGVRVAGKGVSLQLSRCRIGGSTQTNLHADIAASLDATDVVVAGDEASGGGIVALDAATLRLRRVRIQGCRGQGLTALSAGPLEAQRLAVVATSPRDDGTDGVGVYLSQTPAVLQEVRVAGSYGHGIRAGGAISLSLRYVLVADTEAEVTSGAGGEGIALRTGAKATLHGVHVLRGRQFGVTVDDAGTRAEGEQVRIEETRRGEDADRYHSSLVVGEGAEVGWSDVVVVDSLESAVYVSGDGGRLALARALIAHVRALQGDPLSFGVGLQVFAGGTASLSQTRIHGAEGVALVARGAGARVDIGDVLIDGTTPLRATSAYGIGVAVQDGAALHGHGVRLSGNHGAALIADGAGAAVSGVGIVVDDTRAQASDGGGGHGIYAARGATVQLQACLLDRNRATGLAADAAALEADRCVMRRTLFAPLVRPDLRLAAELGDGLLGAAATKFSIRRSIVVDNSRASLLLNATVGAEVVATLLARSAWGIVLQQGAAVDAATVVVRDHSLHNRASDAGLEVPPAPSLGPAKR